MLLLENEDGTKDVDKIIFGRVNEYQYLGAVLNVKNDWSREVSVRSTKTEWPMKIFKIEISHEKNKNQAIRR